MAVPRCNFIVCLEVALNEVNFKLCLYRKVSQLVYYIIIIICDSMCHITMAIKINLKTIMYNYILRCVKFKGAASGT